MIKTVARASNFCSTNQAKRIVDPYRDVFNFESTVSLDQSGKEDRVLSTSDLLSMKLAEGITRDYSSLMNWSTANGRILFISKSLFSP